MAKSKMRDVINVCTLVAKLDKHGKEEVLAFVTRELAIITTNKAALNHIETEAGQA